MTSGVWTGDDERHNDACHHRWVKERHRVTGDPDYPEHWYDEQCGGCAFWIALHGRLGADYGVCSNPVSAFDARVRFEYDGCDAYTGRTDGSFG
ncbi:DUF3027 domain-containing protein [Actinoplanes sp. TRM 88003]|uniref:DUF3027 domain-containing protein n=1 Tax=Paractinoplanes aksuensis TaxID=2939490 RepID=A0ABT1DT22_9ACTN|nr:DUF3027 domain-containing protein [Actinoplanes aksuensis]MCO8273999.1 DUF3027 domain-containing protein [Actinoplanes aksuensis]